MKPLLFAELARRRLGSLPVDGQNSIAAVEPTKMPDSAGPIMAAIEVRLTLFPSS
jgi:hypothetical protein